MKTLRTFGAACVLTLMLTVPALAGHIETGVAPPQPPAPTPTTSGPDTGGTAGHIETGAAPTDPVITTALSLIQSVLTLF